MPTICDEGPRLMFVLGLLAASQCRGTFSIGHKEACSLGFFQPPDYNLEPWEEVHQTWPETLFPETNVPNNTSLPWRRPQFYI